MNLSVTEIDLDTLKREKTQQPPDATHVMVHEMDNSTSLHTVYIKDIPAMFNFEIAEVINSDPPQCSMSKRIICAMCYSKLKYLNYTLITKNQKNIVIYEQEHKKSFNAI